MNQIPIVIHSFCSFYQNIFIYIQLFAKGLTDQRTNALFLPLGFSLLQKNMKKKATKQLQNYDRKLTKRFVDKITYRKTPGIYIWSEMSSIRNVTTLLHFAYHTRYKIHSSCRISDFIYSTFLLLLLLLPHFSTVSKCALFQL